MPQHGASDRPFFAGPPGGGRPLEAAVQETLGLPPDDLAPMLVPLQRSGCYVEITGGYWDNTGGRDHLSTLSPS